MSFSQITHVQSASVQTQVHWWRDEGVQGVHLHDHLTAALQTRPGGPLEATSALGAAAAGGGRVAISQNE